MGQVVQGLVGGGEDLGFYPREVGALEGCGQKREEDLPQVLTCTLWWSLWGGQIVETRVGAGESGQKGLSWSRHTT